MLARKGYPAGIAYRVVRDALDNAGQESPADELGDCEIFGTEFADGERG
jgi:hypothetical protein